MLKRVGWPAFGHLEHLHPEYEVTDFREGKRYIDLAYVRPPFKIAFEIDGCGTHVRDLSRRQFADQWVRQMHLINDGWIVVRIGYDDVKERPRLWQQMIVQLVGRLYGEGRPNSGSDVGSETRAQRVARTRRRRFRANPRVARCACGGIIACGVKLIVVRTAVNGRKNEINRRLVALVATNRRFFAVKSDNGRFSCC